MYSAIRTGPALWRTLLAFMTAFMLSTGHAASQHHDHDKLTPDEALSYMKKTPNLYILDISSPERFEPIHFTGAVNIPYPELISRINELPTGNPVLINCRAGRSSPKAYQLIRQIRPDIPKVVYVNGEPLFEDYNVWREEQK